MSFQKKPRRGKKVILNCHNCQELFEKPQGDINARMKKFGEVYFYCSRECSYEKSHEIKYEKLGLKTQEEYDEYRFWEKVDKTPGHGPNGDCWLWTGTRYKGRKDPYGGFFFNKKHNYAHKYAYLRFKGEIPQGKLLRHSCNVSLCVNPSHLILGTTLENSRDMIEADRQLKGERNPQAKITEATALRIGELLDSGRTVLSVAIELGVPKSTVANIKCGCAWQYLWGRVSKRRKSAN